MVSLLSDQIDRLARATRAINAISNSITTPVTGPFASAVLSTHIGDLIRDIDSSELGLFSLQPSTISPGSQITRAEFAGATPLRKPTSRRIATQDFGEIEPEVYAQAALKCVDRYQTIRPMPRAQVQVADILELLATARRNSQSLINVLQQNQLPENQSKKILLAEEERRIHVLQERLHNLRQSKKDLMALKDNLLPARVTSIPAERNFQPDAALPQECSTGGDLPTRSNALCFSDNLLDEKIDLGDVPPISFMESYNSHVGELSPALSGNRHARVVSLSPQIVKERQMGIQEASEHTKDGEAHSNPPRSSPRGSFPMRRNSEHEDLPPHKNLANTLAHSETASIEQMHVSVTSEVEYITTRIWATVGDVLMPGHSFSVASGQHPGPEETIVHLKSLSSLSPPLKTSDSLISTGPSTSATSQQIMIAQLLLSLLTCPPHFSLSLGKVKAILTGRAKADIGPSATAQSAARTLYGCVAKRLLKIERGGGEQIVEFDVPVLLQSGSHQAPRP